MQLALPYFAASPHSVKETRSTALEKKETTANVSQLA
jgi:hypothetical protein